MRVLEHVLKRIGTPIPETIRNCQAPVIEHAHKAGRISFRRDRYPSITPRGSDEQKRGLRDNAAANIIDRVNVFGEHGLGRFTEDLAYLVNGFNRIRKPSEAFIRGCHFHTPN